MTSSFRSLLIGAALLAFAPACGSTVERRGGDPSDGPVGHDVDDDADDDTDDADDDDVDPIGDPDQPARSSMCPSAVFSGGDADAVAVAWSDTEASLVMRDGSLVALDLPTEVPPAGATAYVGVVVGPEGIVVTRGWTTFENVSTSHTTNRWFDRRGVITGEMVSDDGLWGSYVGADGTTIFYRGVDPYGYVARLPDGTFFEMDGLDLFGEPLASGWLRGYDYTAERATFVNTTTQERRNVDTHSDTYPAFVDDGFAYLEQGEATPILVHATPDATVRTDLSALEGIPIDNLYLTAVPRSTWALLTDYENQRAWRIDLVAGTAELVNAPPPAGSELLEDNCGLSQPMLSTSGQIFAGLRTAGDGQAAIASIDGGWQPIGEPYAQPGTFSVVETAGTFVVTAGEDNMTYCPILEWDEPATPEALAVDKVQLVRPSEDVVRILDSVDPWSVVPSRDGGCVTFTTGAWDGTEIERSIVDLRGDEVLTIDSTYLAWIP